MYTLIETSKLRLSVAKLNIQNKKIQCELNKNNLVLFGLLEDASDSVENCAPEFSRAKLRIQPEIDIAWRIGSAYNTDNPRPVKIELVRIRNRNELWGSRVKLENLFNINNDLLLEVRRKHKFLS